MEVLAESLPVAQLLEQPVRYFFFTGKGGVGKTSLASATALALSEAGKRTLLVSTDPASNLDEVLAMDLTSQPQVVPTTANLFALNINPEAAAAAYREKVVGPMRGLLPESALREMEEQLSGACTMEIAAFDEFTAFLSGDSASADAVIIETMSSIEEAAVAVRAAREQTDLVVIASFTYDTLPDGGFATMMGVRPLQAAESMLAAGAHVLGANCGTGAETMCGIMQELRSAAPETPLLAMPNAGMPVVENGNTCFKETPEEMATKVVPLLAAGVQLLGGCCGTTPAHTAAMRKLLDAH